MAMTLNMARTLKKELPNLTGQFFRLADALEKYADKKLSRFYVTKKQYDEMKMALASEIEMAGQKLREAAIEREVLITSALESRRIAEELSENAKKLLELNNELKELLKQNIKKGFREVKLLDKISAPEVVIRSMKKVTNEFGKKLKTKSKNRK